MPESSSQELGYATKSNYSAFRGILLLWAWLAEGASGTEDRSWALGYPPS
jgi:hypothetical protein